MQKSQNDDAGKLVEEAQALWAQLASGGKGAMIIASHESGEENGMEYFTRWFKEHLPGIHIELIPTTDRLWTL